MKTNSIGRVNGIKQLGRKPLLVKKDRRAGRWKAYSSKGEESKDNPQEEAESRDAPKPSRNPDGWPRPQNRPFGDYKHQVPTFFTPPASSRPLRDTGLDNCTAAESPHQDTLRLQQRLRTTRTHRGTCGRRPCAATVAQDTEASAGRSPAGSPVRDPKFPDCKLRA